MSLTSRSRRTTGAVIGQVAQTAGAVFNAFLDLVGRPERRIVLPSR